MFKLIEYYSRFENARGRIGGLPGWARGLIFIAALPGIALIALSVLGLLVSILALLLLTVPLYRVLKALVGTTAAQPGQASAAAADEAPAFGFADDGDPSSPGRKKVDVTIIE